MCFWDVDCILMVDYLQKGQIISGFCFNILRQLRENIKVKYCGKLCKGVLFHRGNAPADILIAMAAINDYGFGLIQHPSYSPDVTLLDFRLFPKLKKAIFGTHFQSDDDIVHTVKDFLDRQEEDFFKCGIKAL